MTPSEAPKALQASECSELNKHAMDDSIVGPYGVAESENKPKRAAPARARHATLKRLRDHPAGAMNAAKPKKAAPTQTRAAVPKALLASECNEPLLKLPGRYRPHSAVKLDGTGNSFHLADSTPENTVSQLTTHKAEGNEKFCYA